MWFLSDPIEFHYASTTSETLQQVTSVAAEQEREQSNLKETMRNDEPHMPLQKPINKKFQQKRLSHSSNPQREKTCPEKERKTTYKKNSRQTQKRKRQAYSFRRNT